MRSRVTFNCYFLSLICLLLLAPALYAKMYRWVDDYGNIYYSDKVPPESNKYKRDSLNDSARVIETTEAEKSKDEKNLNQRLSRLRKQQQQVISEQQEQDKVLVNTFRTEDDILRALKEKLRSLETRKKVSQGNLNRLQFQLQGQQKMAADYELKGKKVPKSLLSEIGETEKQIGLVNRDLGRLDLKARQTQDRFDKDIHRFKILTQKNRKSFETSLLKTPEQLPPSDLGLFTCKDKSHCNSAWEVARLYIQNHATTEIELDNKKLIMTFDPEKDEDIGLSVSKIKNSAGQSQLFLDIKCSTSQSGKKLCLSAKVRSIRADFVPFIDALLPAN